jgi:hypothetical protein
MRNKFDKNRFRCDGAPSLTNYGRGCRCDLCRSIKNLYERERRAKVNKDRPKKPKKPAGRRDNPIVFNDAYSMVDIIRANPHLDWSEKQRKQAGV